MWEILPSNADWGLFQDSDFAGDLEDSKSTSGGTLCIFGSHTFVPISWMCKKQTSVSHSSTESEIISLDTGLRLDGKPAVDLWDLIVEVLGNTHHDIENGETRVNLQPHRPVGKLVQQSLGEALQSGSSKPTQSPEPIEDRTGKPVTQEIVGKLQEELSSSDRPGKPETKEEQHVRNHDGSGKPDGEEKLHKVQEDCHLKNRDDADKFDLATDDKTIIQCIQ